jgi:phosphoserine phosphatase
MNDPLMLAVSIDDQRLDLVENNQVVASYPVSTATKGVGFVDGSYRTPIGRFRVAEKVGHDEIPGTVFRNREPQGLWLPGNLTNEDLILTRILRLDGLDAANANTLDRNIYIHGTNREDLLGTPASHGCIRMRNAEVLELFRKVPEGTLVVIHPPTRKRGKVIFLDCDSTLSGIEGIDELARARGHVIFEEIVALTNAAMNGEVPLDEVFGRRMEIIRPTQSMADRVAIRYLETVTPGMSELVSGLQARGWLTVILSGGFAPLIEPLARSLGIEHIEAVPLYFDHDGNYAGYGADYPTTRSGGKNVIIREWRQAMLPERVVMIGDGVSDLETKPDVDMFVGFGGVVAREPVRRGADYWLSEMIAESQMLDVIDGGTDRLT